MCFMQVSYLLEKISHECAKMPAVRDQQHILFSYKSIKVMFITFFFASGKKSTARNLILDHCLIPVYKLQPLSQSMKIWLKTQKTHF